MGHYVAEFVKLGHQDRVKKFQDKIILEEVFALIDQSFISDKRKRGMKALIERRHKELEEGVGK